MYEPSNLFKVSFNYALSRVEDKNSQIFILSAKHHLLSLSTVIDPYNKRLNKNPKKNIKWAEIVYKQMSEIFDIENTQFIFLAGNDYIAPLIPYLDNGKYSNPIPLECRSIGKRMKWLKENTNRVSIIVQASYLRDRDYMHKIPNNVPGWYKWWAPKEALELLLNSSYITKKYLTDLLKHLTVKNINGKNYYYIYVGVAIKESIRNRINWHVNQQHTKSSVESGFLSTLRQTISSLVAGNQYDEIATNNLIDMLMVEYYPVDLPIKSIEAKEKIEDIEKNELTNNVLPLNLRDNKNSIIKEYLKELSNARKNSK